MGKLLLPTVVLNAHATCCNINCCSINAHFSYIYVYEKKSKTSRDISLNELILLISTFMF